MKNNEWSSVVRRYSEKMRPEVKPSFKLSSTSKIITIGSCFARNIEEHLSIIGVNLPTYEYISPYSESPNRPNGVLNKFTPSSIKEELVWAYNVIVNGLDFKEQTSSFMFRLSDGNVIDLQLNFSSVSEDRFYERRKEILKIYKNLIDSDCVTITLGLVERWIDLETGLSIFSAPNVREMIRAKGRFVFSPLDFSESKSEVESIIDIIRKFNPDINILITTSPVPLNKTFKDMDVFLANSYSKSILRSVCGEVSNAYEDVDYFPSYEMITYQDPTLAFGDDLRHVNDHIVGDVVDFLINNYFVDICEYSKSLRSSLGDLTSGKKNTDNMNFVLDNYNSFKISENDWLLLSRVAWRCGRKKLASDFLSRYFNCAKPDPRALRAINYVAKQTKKSQEFKVYLEDILIKDPGNKRARKFYDEHIEL